MNEFILTADIAKKRDYFALMLFRDTARIIEGNSTLETADKVIHYFDITNIEQYQGLGFEEMADRILTVMSNPLLKLNTTLLVDGTGIGEAAVELIRKRGLYPIPIIFTGGAASVERYSNMGEIFNNNKLSGARVLKEISVPKEDLVAAGSVLMGQGRVRVAPGRWTERFKTQLAGFKGKVNEKSGRVKYEAETEADHDDLVVCYLMGAWWILHRHNRAWDGGKMDVVIKDKENTSGWEPDDYM
jgi:hypothetical protein